MTITYRFADISEAEAISQVIIDTLISTSSLYYKQNVIDRMIEFSSKEKIESMFALGVFYCAYDDNKVIGCGSIREEEICRFFVSKEYQGKGVGSTILAKLIEVHKEKYPTHCIQIHATINAKSLYEKFHFYVIQEIHDDYDGDIYIMQYDHSLVKSNKQIKNKN